jgi:anti-anti-sigma regulatory factor
LEAWGTSVARFPRQVLRISAAGRGEQATTLRLEGKVTGPWVTELRRVCAQTLANTGHSLNHLVLDLAGVSFLDPDAIALFYELSKQRVVFTNGSPFIAEQLKGVADVTS